MNWIINEMIFLSYFWINIGFFDLVWERENNLIFFLGSQVSPFMIALIPYVYLLNLS